MFDCFAGERVLASRPLAGSGLLEREAFVTWERMHGSDGETTPEGYLGIDRARRAGASREDHLLSVSGAVASRDEAKHARAV